MEIFNWPQFPVNSDFKACNQKSLRSLIQMKGVLFQCLFSPSLLFARMSNPVIRHKTDYFHGLHFNSFRFDGLRMISGLKNLDKRAKKIQLLETTFLFEFVGFWQKAGNRVEIFENLAENVFFHKWPSGGVGQYALLLQPQDRNFPQAHQHFLSLRVGPFLSLISS